MFYWDIVYEWENVLSENLGLPFIYSKKMQYSKIAAKFSGLFSLLMTNKNALQFEMIPSYHRVSNKRNIIPWIIDFYPTEDILPAFVRNYDKSVAVLVSSRQVWQWLIDMKCPLNIQHLALSLSDKYHINKDTRFEKQYNLIVTGRKNPVLMNFLGEYLKRHPDFTYIYLKPKDGHQNYYLSTGSYIGTYDSREEYMSLLKQARIAFYSTSGVDGDTRKGTNGFNQVTPKFLEFIASGCHVISRYVENEDTDYYEMGQYSMRTDSYESFEKAMEYAMNHDFDYGKASEYLHKHYTSKRGNELRVILRDL